MGEGGDYDVVVIGAGPAGENAADYARQHGLEVAIVEQELVGGECSYWACMPSKALLRPTEVLAELRRVPGAARAAEVELDVDEVLRGRDTLAAHWDDAGQVAWLDDVGVVLVRGRGRLAGERTVEVTSADGDATRLHARHAVVIAVGSRASLPPVDGLAEARPWDNRDVTAMRTVPDRLLILGGGPVGVEMAQAVARLGASEVTVVERSPRLLPNEEPFAGAAIETALRSDGVRVELGASATAVARVPDHGSVALQLADGRELIGDELLVATGRAAPTADLGLDTVGVEPGNGGFVAVGADLRVPGLPWLYVVGDANGRGLLTHHGKHQGRLVGDALGRLAGERATTGGLAGLVAGGVEAAERALARVVFTDPNVAAAGLTEARAREAGHEVVTVAVGLDRTAAAPLHGKGVDGTAQLVVDRQRRVLLGATFVGPGAGEQIHAATVAIVGEVELERLWHAVAAFPTLSEVWLRLLEELRATA